MSEEIQVWLSSREQSASTENTTQSQQRIEEDLVGVKKTLELLADHIKDPPPQPHLPQLKKDLQPITERLDAVSSELRTMRQLKERTPPPPAPSVCTEMALADIVKQIQKPTYAQVASKPSVPRPNHTLIISSTDPKNTGDNVIEKIRVALDCKKTGAKVEKGEKGKEPEGHLKLRYQRRYEKPNNNQPGQSNKFDYGSIRDFPCNDNQSTYNW
ncbi:hypothetical protein SFRURICE_016201 [Spodoptera frugiperda]|nr:hypothetical protein SFRURICE_016201 [Spodoptera frugiperda]